MYLSNPVYQTTPSVFRPTDEFTVTPAHGGRHQIKLSGKLPPRWLANLASGLSSHGITILHGYANKVSPTVWEGTFEIMPTIGSALPANLDYLAMASTSSVAAAEALLVLKSFTIRPHDGSLYVEIVGEDSVGFLTTLLKLFAFYSLHPAEISVDTPGGKVHDRFWLKGLAGLAPTNTVAEILHQELSKHLAQGYSVPK